MSTSAFLLSLCFIALVQRSQAEVGGYLDYNGFRYILANTAIDPELTDFTGDDCPSAPCQSFAIPNGCNASFPTSVLETVALSKPWATSYLATRDGLFPVVSFLTKPPNPPVLDLSVPGSVTLSESSWQARVILRCLIPCPPGTALRSSGCVSCAVGNWSSGGTNGRCVPCTNGPPTANYTSVGTANNCTWNCGARTYTKDGLNPFLLVGDLTPPYSIRSVDSNRVVSTFYTPQLNDLTVNYKFMLLSADKQSLYIGNQNVNKLNLANKSYVTLAGRTIRGSSDGLGTLASFNSISGAALWQNESYILLVDGPSCNVRMLNLTANSTFPVTTLVGSTSMSCGMLNGVGTAARFRFPLDIAVDSSQTTAYVSDSGNFVVRAINLTSSAVTTLVGNGGTSSVDGVGTAASIDPRYLTLSPSGATLFVKTPTAIRAVNLATLLVETLNPAPLPFSPYQLVASALDPQTLYFGGNFRVASFFLPSGEAFDIAGSSTPAFVDGVGRDARFTLPSLIVLLNETVAPASMCPACTRCPAGQFGSCNATASECLPCPAGFSSLRGASACFPCSPGSYSAGGLCLACPPGSSSGNGSTTCTNCTAGTFRPRFSPVCLNCSAGTFSADAGATLCRPCTNLTGNGSWAGPGTNSTNCAFGCRPGFSLVEATGMCSPCGPGTFTAPGSAVCGACTNLPDNANYSGVGGNATNCPFRCQAGFVSNGTACLPCPAGTRMLAGVCVNCTAGSFSAPPMTGCAVCPSGNFSLPGAPACTPCPNAGPYTNFVGRATSPACPFSCKAGSFMANRTACLPCLNGTFSGGGGATACAPCTGGKWSGAAAAACTTCASLSISAMLGAAGVVEFPLVGRSGFGVTSFTCSG